MNYLNDPLFLRQIIMDHYENPRNKRDADPSTHQHIQMSTDSCIDDLTIEVEFSGTTIKDVCFVGEACTIATASTSIMTELIKGKTIEEAEYILKQYRDMIDLLDYDAEALQEAVAFKNVGKQASRIRCATLGWRGVETLIERVKTDGKR